MRNLSNPSAGDIFVGIVSPAEGGTGQQTQSAARVALSAVPASAIGAASGVAGLDVDGKMLVENIPTDMFNLISVVGPTSVIRGTSNTYTINNYDVFTDYVIEEISGTTIRIGDTITYVAPVTTGNAGFIINGRTIPIAVSDFKPQTPIITSPVNAASILVDFYNLTSAAYVNVDGSTVHSSSDWVISTSNAFTNIVRQTTDDTVNKTSWSVSGLPDGVTYHARVRYKSGNGAYSEWSPTISFTVAIPLPVKPTFTSHANNGANYSATAQLVTSAFSIQGSVATHESTDWQLSLVSNFATTVVNRVDDTVNKTTLTVPGLLDNTSYFMRVRYKASNGKISDWSDTIRVNVIFAFPYSQIIVANTNNYNMRAAAVAAGWNQVTPLQMTVTVNNGVVVGSGNTGIVAFDTGASFPVGSSLSLINNGSITGAGGGGGAAGGYSVIDQIAYPGSPGGAGGAGLRVQYALSINNTSGSIAGGGGGGGGGAASGNGLGSGEGAGGAGGAGGNGAGSAGGNSNGINPMNGWGGIGGNGGILGATGAAGQSVSGSQGNLAGGAGGAAGAAVIGNTLITWTANGTRLGAIT